MISEEQKELIENNALALATVDLNGNSHCIAVGYVKVIDNNKILVTNNFIVNTVKNINVNNNISLVVWNRDWEKDCVGYEFLGKAECFKDGKWYEKVRNMPENKKEPCKGAILITIKNIKKLA